MFPRSHERYIRVCKSPATIGGPNDDLISKKEEEPQGRRTEDGRRQAGELRSGQSGNGMEGEKKKTRSTLEAVEGA